MGFFGSPAPFLFSCFAVATVGAKIAHLVAHITAIPLSAFILYLPTFLCLDFIVICAARLLFHNGRSAFSLACALVGTVISLISVGGSASQIGFLCKTGGELQWRDAQAYANKEGMTVLMSGSTAVIGFAALIFTIALIGRNIFYNAFGNFLQGFGEYLLLALRLVKKTATNLRSRTQTQTRSSPQIGSNRDGNLDYSTEFLLAKDRPRTSDDDDADDRSEGFSLLGGAATEKQADSSRSRRRRCSIRVPAWILIAVATLYLSIAHLVRPGTPYNFISITLPISMLDVFKYNADYCTHQRRMWHNPWPYPKLTEEVQWEGPHANFKGWAPGPKSTLAAEYRKRTPDWLPERPPRGFFRWDPLRFKKGFWGFHTPPRHPHHHHHRKPRCPGIPDREPYYNPIDDPMKITNLDNDILEPLREPLANGTVKIKNVVLILMESLREELFPLKHGSEIYKNIMEANEGGTAEFMHSLNEKLSQITPHVERLTGVSGNFRDANGAPYPLPEMKWNDQTRPGFGGINVVGAHTGATMSTKSYGSTHCGAWAMPVEKFAEAETDAYQPCLPQILDLFNKAKGGRAATDDDDFRKQQWLPALFEAEVEEYDRQEVFDRKLGWKYIFTRKQLEAGPRFNASDVLYHKVNYFGYPEPVLKPYIEDYIRDATANNQRIFMSHFTSTTHHAWDTPEGFPTYHYLPNEGLTKWHRDFNKYLNTIRYHDRWMGELMQLFDDVGIANETLVVFVGDHGQAFREDYHKTATYENPHVTNFRVPITFKHPHLPRVQYNATVSSISILPTILDLLINSGSLDKQDTAAASDIIQDYEGQSLIRPYKAAHNGRRAWAFSVINSGAGMLAVTSADVKWRLVMPLGKVVEYRVSDMVEDPAERDPVTAWTYEELLDSVRDKLGKDAKSWAEEAVAVSKWWIEERKRLWRYKTLPFFPGMEGLAN